MWLKLVGTDIFLFWEFLVVDKFSLSYPVVSFFLHEIKKIIFTRTSRDRKFQENKKCSARKVVSWYKYFSHPLITDSNQTQNSNCLIVVHKRSFEPWTILLYSTGLINNCNQTPPPSTGLLGRPLPCREENKQKQGNKAKRATSTFVYFFDWLKLLLLSSMCLNSFFFRFVNIGVSWHFFLFFLFACVQGPCVN